MRSSSADQRKTDAYPLSMQCSLFKQSERHSTLRSRYDPTKNIRSQISADKKLLALMVALLDT